MKLLGQWSAKKKQSDSERKKESKSEIYVPNFNLYISQATEDSTEGSTGAE